MIEADLAVVDAAELVTLAGPSPRVGRALRALRAIPGGSVACRDGVIVFAGTGSDFRREVRLMPGAVVIDARDRTVLPGFVDPHTHLPFAGWRDAEFVSRPDGATYGREVAVEMVPEVARRGLARFCDFVVEQGAFSLEEAETILRAAAAAGLGLRVHADQRRAGGGAALAARLRADSADHLDHVDEAGIAALRRSGTTAVLLPGASFFLRDPRDAPARG